MMIKLLLLALSVFSVVRSVNVRVDLFVMSKCPDAVACEMTFAPVVTEIGSIMDVHVNYIATPEGNGFSCLHGPSECIGNMQQLCAQWFYPNNYYWWDFALCQTESVSEIPNNGQACANRIRFISYPQIAQCVAGPLGPKLFNASIAFTESLGITTSCTMNVNSQLFCVHNNGNWECNYGSSLAMIQYICQQYTMLNNQVAPQCSSFIQ